MRVARSVWLVVAIATAAGAGVWSKERPRPHNVILFVADGLRAQIVTPETAPALAALRAEGVDFQNSHSVYPTVTTVNASAMATGHQIGDTGDFGNAIYVGQPPVEGRGVVLGLEDNGDFDAVEHRFGGNYLNEDTILSTAAAQGYSTASVGKRGPVAVHAGPAGDGVLVIDDSTGQPAPDGFPLPPDVTAEIAAAGLPPKPPGRGPNGDQGTFERPGATTANLVQQDWFAKVAGEVLLPRFKKAGKPFVMVYWSRDPDGTQHNQGDSLGRLKPGINGPTTMAAIRNASDNLQRLREALKREGLDKTTDIIVTADHGFATISKESRTSPSARLRYTDTTPGFLPPGFLAADLALALKQPVWTPTGEAVDLNAGVHPSKTGALIGPDPSHPLAVVAVNGGSDLIYLPGPERKATARRVAEALMRQDYAGAVFVEDALGPIPGTLPMSRVNLMGSARTPRPAIVVSFRSFSTGCARPETCVAIVSDTDLQQGQGSHGSISRGETHNFMAAVGPDFKRGFRDPSPVSNADLARTIAKAAGLTLSPKGKLEGRLLVEALQGGPARVPSQARVLRSEPGPGGFRTVLNYQEAKGVLYLDAAGMPGRVFGVEP